jgi:hypothetical protein
MLEGSGSILLLSGSVLLSKALWVDVILVKDEGFSSADLPSSVQDLRMKWQELVVQMGGRSGKVLERELRLAGGKGLKG